jgi:hypothetical protein
LVQTTSSFINDTNSSVNFYSIVACWVGWLLPRHSCAPTLPPVNIQERERRQNAQKKERRRKAQEEKERDEAKKK